MNDPTSTTIRHAELHNLLQWLNLSGIWFSYTRLGERDSGFYSIRLPGGTWSRYERSRLAASRATARALEGCTV